MEKNRLNKLPNGNWGVYDKTGTGIDGEDDVVNLKDLAPYATKNETDIEEFVYVPGSASDRLRMKYLDGTYLYCDLKRSQLGNGSGFTFEVVPYSAASNMANAYDGYAFEKCVDVDGGSTGYQYHGWTRNPETNILHRVYVQDFALAQTVTSISRQPHLSDTRGLYNVNRTTSEARFKNIINNNPPLGLFAIGENWSVIKNYAMYNLALIGGVLKLPNIHVPTNYAITLRMTGAVQGGVNSGNVIVSLGRPDGTILSNKALSKATFNDQEINFVTYTDGVNDPFTTNGFQIYIRNETGNLLDITSVSLRVQRL